MENAKTGKSCRNRWKAGVCAAGAAAMLTAGAFGMSAYGQAQYYVDPEHPYNAPIHGMFHHQPVISSQVDGEYSVYIPEALQPWRPVVIILAPDGTTAEDFSAGETGRQWIAAADENQFALAFLQADGSWNVRDQAEQRDEAEYLKTVYTQLRSKSGEQDAVFTTDKSHMSLIGYQEGGTAAYEIAAEYPAIFCNVTAVDAPALESASLLEQVGEQYSYPFPADSFNGQNEIKLKNREIPVPIWSMGEEGSHTAIGYWEAVNQGRAEVRRTEAHAAPQEIWSQFMSKNGRFLGWPGGTLAPTESFATRADGSGYRFYERKIDGYVRRWLVYVPESYQGQEVPLVVVSHGYSASMYALAEESRWADVAEQNGFLAVFPQAYLNERTDGNYVPVPTWNSGLFALGAPATDDVSFIRQMLEQVKQEYAVDSSRVYATGHSNGGSLTWLLGRSMTRTFAAIAPVGLMAPGEASDDMSLLLPSWSFKGEYDGDGMELNAGSNNLKTLNFWKSWNGLDQVQQEETTEGAFTTYTYRKGEAPLVRYTAVKNSPHAYLTEEAVMIWQDFFSKFSRGTDGTVYYEGKAVEK